MEIAIMLHRRLPATADLLLSAAMIAVAVCMPAVAISAKDVVLTLRQDGKDFDDAFRGIKNELSDDFDVVEQLINKKCTAGEFADLIRSHKPRLVILMDNHSVALFGRYQASLPADTEFIPSVSLMGVLISDAIANLKNATGISYEVPIVTSIINLRSALAIPMKKVGVIHRGFLNDFIDRNKHFCASEGIEIVNVTLPNKSDDYRSEVKNALDNLINQGIDGLWVPNDNALLQSDIIQQVWVPAVKRSKIAVIVGVEVLVNPKLEFGTFAVLPDHVALGIQAAEMIYEIKDNGWTVKNGQVDPPLAVYKIVNISIAKQKFNVKEDRLKGIDKKLK